MPAIVLLLVLSALMELFGTITVWMNYSRGADLAGLLLQEVEAEEEREQEIVSQHPRERPTELNDVQLAPFRIEEEEKRMRRVRAQIGAHLDRKWYVSAGLTSYVLGALAGLAAGLLALAR